MDKHLTEEIKKSQAAEPRRLPFTARDAWRLRRQDMERRKVKSHPRLLVGRRWDLLGKILKVAMWMLRALGLRSFAKRTALDVELTRIELNFPGLPAEFDGYKILHVTDPHFDLVPEIISHMLAALPREEVDIAVLTGDYRDRTDGEHKQILDPMAQLCRAIHAKDGTFVTLGNHDTVNMVPDFESMGLRVLANESVALTREGASIGLTGIDDVHYYYTEQALEALARPKEAFKIALVHSNEIASEAAAFGYSFYLSGHTHGGQICLPSGIPIVTHTDTPRSMAKGLWRVGELIGFTSRGAGVVALPLRVFSRGEITLFTLRKGPASV